MRGRWIWPPVVAAIMALASCAGPPPDSGVQGTVRAGPTCPVQRADEPCPDRLVQTRLEAIRMPAGFVGTPAPDQGTVVARFASDASGRFRVALPAGTYMLYGAPDATGYPSGCRGQATVAAHRWAQADVGCDTGIR